VNLRQLAKGMDCQVRLPGICNFNAETTVLAHYRLAGSCGVGMKPHDLLGAWACSECHDHIDGRQKSEMHRDYFRRLHAEGVMRTINELIKRGKLK